MATGYKFNNENAAKNAANALKAHYLGGRPTGEYVTTEWVEVLFDAQGFYYFLGDYSPVLGNPEQLELTPVEI